MRPLVISLVLAALSIGGCLEPAPDNTYLGLSFDEDRDGVADLIDPAPLDPRFCGDDDSDGCDDCSILGRYAPGEDGFDPDGDSHCEVAVSWDCMNGANAADDPYRLESCVQHTLINQDREHFAEESGNAAPTRWNEDIWVVAHAHAVDMCERGYFSHTNLAGLDPSGRAAAAGLDYGLAENISANFDPRSTQYGFMSEPTCVGHRGNILDRRLVEVGIGYHKCNNPGSMYGTNDFTVQNFRGDWSLSPSDYCSSAATECELPDDPPSVATCPENLMSFCESPSIAWLSEWACPND